jgi:Putative zinc-finger
MNCEDIQPRLDDYLDGSLDTASATAVRTHVAECESCRRQLADSRALIRALRALPIDGPTRGFEDHALARAADSWRGAGRRVPRLALGTLVAACAAGIVTVVLMGPFGEAPFGDVAPDFPVVDMTVDQPRTINLVFASSSALEDVSLLVELPEGVELAGYAGKREVLWRTSMQAGKNVLPLELVARMSASGEIIAHLQHADRERVFRVFVSAVVG